VRSEAPLDSARRVGVLGLGHVGLPTALALAETGSSVIGTDNDAGKVETIARGQAPFFEPGLQDLLRKHLDSGRFRAVTDVGEAVRLSDILFICVGTPHREDGSADLSQVECTVQTIAENLNGYKLVVEKSTAPVRTAQWIEQTMLRHGKDRGAFEVACNPEFLREGAAIENCLRPDRVVLGVQSPKAEKWLRDLYAPLKCKLLVTDMNTAEIIKHASNSFLALKISFINMVSDLCEKTGADVRDVAKGLGMDPRIGPAFLNAGLGYGGFCLPKDLRAFIHVAEEFGVDFFLLREVERINRARVHQFLRRLRKALGTLHGKRLAVWGLAFKPKTDDLREAPSLLVVRELLASKASLSLFDPQAMDNFRKSFPENPTRVVYCSSAEEAATGADAILVLTEWPEFENLDWQRLRQKVALPVVVDGRNILDRSAAERAGFEYYGIGLPIQPRTEVRA
jgi:UDPglucose 6-dehydrogenase